MAIISFDQTKTMEYMPEYGGKRNEPRKVDGEYEKPCVVKLKLVPYAKIQEYASLIASRNKAINDSSRYSEVLQGVQRTQFLASVESISGFIMDGREITEPEEFFNNADAELIYEILAAMESSAKLTEGQAKNFARVSGGQE